MVGAVAQTEGIIIRLCGKERFHAFHLKLHFDIGRQLGIQFLHSIESVLFCV